MKNLKQTQAKKRGAALVEYGLIVAGVALVAAGSVAIFGHKTSALIASSARIIPGENANDNKVIEVGEIIATKTDANGFVTIDASKLNNTLDQNLGLDETNLIHDPNHP